MQVDGVLREGARNVGELGAITLTKVSFDEMWIGKKKDRKKERKSDREKE